MDKKEADPIQLLSETASVDGITTAIAAHLMPSGLLVKWTASASSTNVKSWDAGRVTVKNEKEAAVVVKQAQAALAKCVARVKAAQGI